MDQKINTKTGVIIILIIAFTAGLFVVKSEKGKKFDEMKAQDIVVNKEVAENSSKSDSKNYFKNISYQVNPEKPVCDTKTSLVNWDESRNGSYHIRNTDYFTFSYPCNYKISFSDMGSFYYLSKKGNIENSIIISGSLYENFRVKIAKELYPGATTEILDKKININYPYNIYLIKIDKNAKQECGECLEYPGHTYNGVDIKINDRLYYSFQADSKIDKNELFKIAESFNYHLADNINQNNQGKDNEIIDTSDWKIYQSNENRFRFKYPSQLSIEAHETSKYGDYFIKNNSENISFIKFRKWRGYIIEEGTPGTFSEGIGKSNWQYFSDNIGKISSGECNDETLKHVNALKAPEYCTIESNKDFFKIETEANIIYIDKNIEIRWDFRDNKELVEKIVSTFTII